MNLGDVYENNRTDKGIGYSIKQCFGLIPFAGGCMGSGIGYVGGNIGGAIKEFASEIPYLTGLDGNGYAIGERLTEVFYKSMENGYKTGSQLAAIGFIAGLLLTTKGKSFVKGIFGK